MIGRAYSRFSTATISRLAPEVVKPTASPTSTRAAGAAVLLAAAAASQVSCESVSSQLEQIRSELAEIKGTLKPPNTIKSLIYWNGRGLMDVPRAMLAISGKFPGTDYEDVRIGDRVDVAKKGGDPDKVTPYPAVMNMLGANFGRVPICATTEGSIGQSAAINYYVASECGMLGKGPFETAQVLAVCEHVKELGDAYRGLVPYGSAPTALAGAKFFDSDDATDLSGPADGTKRSARFLKWYMGRLEGLVGGGGFAVGHTLTLADVVIYAAFANALAETDALGTVPAHRREPFGDLDKTNAALASHPKLKAIVDNVAANQNLQKWLATRGKQGF
jgi:glutathione S-transferase